MTGLFLCLESGRKVQAWFLPKSNEYVTFPADKFWTKQCEHVTGLWTKFDFLKLFTAIGDPGKPIS